MISCRPVSNGSACRYYLKDVVVGDMHRSPGVPLDTAQDLAGVPQGQWLGRALSWVGLVADEAVTQSEMMNLFGRGRHPRAEKVITDRLAEGD